MSYTAAIDQLNAMVPELFALRGQARRKFSLDEIRVLLEVMDNPQRRYPCVLIAGTNGKGSTAATLASILTASGVRTGLYTSPHLERINERMRVGREEIGDDDFASTYFRVHDAAQQLVLSGQLEHLPSYFEMLTAQAFEYFREARVELAVLEVGMGGRLDATNIADPLLSIVTDISLDHTEWLGETIAEITREKAGILRPGGTLITLPQHPDANQVLGEVAEELGVHAVSAVPYMPGIDAGAAGPYRIEALGEEIVVDSPLAGAHQHRNRALAIAAAVELKERHGFPVTPGSLEAGIRGTVWPGRLERLSARGVEWILDVAHNPAGAWALRAALSSAAIGGRPRVLVFSCLRDKAIDEMAQILFPVFERVVLAPLHSSRAAAMDDLMAAARLTGTPAVAAETVDEALRLGRAADQGEPVVISGSLYLVGEARSLLLRDVQEP
jgi:dihydrofolate synthase / folylpolyglutamate synthase